jgi:hypothetical protein
MEEGIGRAGPIMRAETSRATSYQWMLRALGAFLDEEPSCRLTLAEVPDGFLVRVHRSLHKMEPKLFHFNRDTLTEQLEELERQRATSLRRVHHPGIWSTLPNGHQDFFRALGFELDAAGAHAILIEEVEDGLVLSYSCDDPDTGEWRKRMLVLGLPEMEEILNAAFERREKPSPMT